MSKGYQPNEAIVAAWQEQLAVAVRPPQLARELVERGAEVLPRFAGFHAALRALPRGRRRTLQRQLGLTLATAALLLALGNAPAPAATITVDGTFCTLADAITAANTDAASGGCAGGNAADTLVLSPDSRHTLTGVNTDFHGPTGLPVVSSEILIEGNGAVIERSVRAPEFRILAVDTTGILTLEQATLTGGGGVVRGGGLYSYWGNVTIANSTISGNAAVSGGGVSGYAGRRLYEHGTSLLTIADSTISGNSGGGVDVNSVYNDGDVASTITRSIISDNSGAGVRDRSSFGGKTNTTIADSTVSGNTGNGIYVLTGYGGGSALAVTNSTVSGNARGVYVYSFYGSPNTITITGSTISGNSDAGVFNSTDGAGGTITIGNSTISGNGAGGVSADAGARSSLDVAIADSTISGNATPRSGAGVTVFAGYSSENRLTITNSTISGNTAAATGGGVFTIPPGYDGLVDIEITDSTITGNSAGDVGGGVHVRSDAFPEETVLTFNRSIIAGNIAPSGPEAAIGSGQFVTVTADAFNLFGIDGDAGVVGFVTGLSDIVPAPGVLIGDILDPVLADDGGSTLTHALVLGSPAIDAIPSTETGCAGVDQRGLSRPQDGDADGVSACDIGAYELEAEEVAFERFDIASARVRLRQRAGRDRFNVAGGFRLGAQTDGVDVLNEAVSVTLEGFSETIPPGSFRRVRRREREDEFRGRRFVYNGPSGGIRRLELVIGGVDGRFSIDERKLDLDGLGLPAMVAVTLRIGDDVAQATISLNRRGSLINQSSQQVVQGN